MGSLGQGSVHPQSLTWNLKMMVSKRNLLPLLGTDCLLITDFSTDILRCYCVFGSSLMYITAFTCSFVQFRIHAFVCMYM